MERKFKITEINGYNILGKWTETDFRFTTKGQVVYAFLMKTPEKRTAVIRSFKDDEKILSVKLLGSDQVPFSWNYGVLSVKLPEKMPTPYLNCIAIELAV